MLQKKVPLSNDQIDKHGQRMSVLALENAMRQTNVKIMSSHAEHNFISPPIGRMENAQIEKDDKGVTWLFGTYSLFELEDIEKENPIENRCLSIHSQDSGNITIFYDKSYEDEGLEAEIEHLQQLFDPNNKIQYELKKSVEPISTLTILIGAGSFIAGGFVSGFLNEAGKDAYNALKQIISRRKDNNIEQHYQFIFVFQNEYYKTEILLIFKNPQPDDIKSLIERHESEIEKKVISYYEEEIRVGRIVFLAENSSIQHVYSVYRCGTPFDIANKEQYKEILSSKKSQISP